MAISGHRNEQSLRSYNARPSSAQLQHSSDVLSNVLSATTVTSTSIQIHPQAPQAQTLSQSAQSFYRNATFTNMFSGCSIGSVQVVVKPHREVDETRSIYKAWLSLFWLQFTRRPSHFLLFCGLKGQISPYFCHKTVALGVVPCMSNSWFISFNPLAYHWLVDQISDVQIA